jgi:hypothetical protein
VALRADHLQLAAPPGCEPEARWFFGELLGLTEVDKPEPLIARGGVWFGLDGEQQLHIGVTEAFTPATKAHPALALDSVGELEELAVRLAAAGCMVDWDASLPDVTRLFTSDPWGNRIELLARPAAEPGRSG